MIFQPPSQSLEAHRRDLRGREEWHRGTGALTPPFEVQSPVVQGAKQVAPNGEIRVCICIYTYIYMCTYRSRDYGLNVVCQTSHPLPTMTREPQVGFLGLEVRDSWAWTFQGTSCFRPVFLGLVSGGCSAVLWGSGEAMLGTSDEAASRHGRGRLGVDALGSVCGTDCRILPSDRPGGSIQAKRFCHRAQVSEGVAFSETPTTCLEASQTPTASCRRP